MWHLGKLSMELLSLSRLLLTHCSIDAGKSSNVNGSWRNEKIDLDKRFYCEVPPLSWLWIFGVCNLLSKANHYVIGLQCKFVPRYKGLSASADKMSELMRNGAKIIMGW